MTHTATRKRYEPNERLSAAGLPKLDYRFLHSLEEEGLLRSSWAPG